MSSDNGREKRVYDWVGALSRIDDRSAGSHGEREAAERVGEWMRELGFEQVSTSFVASRPRAGLVLAMHTGVAALAMLIGGLIGVLLAVLSVASWFREMKEQQPLLTRVLDVDESVNVVARAGAREPRRRVVLSAHIDTAQAGFVFSKELADFFARGARAATGATGLPVGPLALPQLLLMAGAVLVTAGWMGAHGFWFGLLSVVVILGLLVASAAGLQWAYAEPTPGANDNASAVASMLTCAEQLLADLPDDVELWAVGTGAEEVGMCGMISLLNEHPGWGVDDTRFVNFECTGGGNLHYIVTEGTGAKGGYPPQMLELSRRVAASGDFGEVTPTDLLAGTDGRGPADRGFPTLSLITLEDNGVPRNYHQREDVVDGLDLAVVVRAGDFGAAVARAALRGDADPISIL